MCLLLAFSASPALAQNVGLNISVPVTGSQNVIYGNNNGGAGTQLLLLQSSGANRFFVDTSGNLTLYSTGNINTPGTITASGGNSTQWNSAASHVASDADTSASNEIQTLGTSGNNITLTSGGSVQAPYANSAGNANACTNDGTCDFAYLQPSSVGGDSGQGANSYGIFQEGGAWTNPYPDLRIAYHTGIKIGAYYGYNGTRFYNNSDMATELMSVGNTDNNVRVAYDLYVGSAGRWMSNTLAKSGDQLNSGAYLGLNGGTSYGLGVNGTNRNTAIFDTVDSTGSDTLELNYYTGSDVRIGDGSGQHDLLVSSGNVRFGNYGNGMYGVYSDTRYQNVFSMGAAYGPSADGTSLSNMYGIAWTHSNIGGQSKGGLEHQMLVVNHGETYTALGNGIWTKGNLSANEVYARSWLRNDTAGEGVYNDATGEHFFSAGPNYWHMTTGSGQTSGALILYDQYNATHGGGTGRKGYLYWDGSGFGLLSNRGNWAVRIPQNSEDVYMPGTVNTYRVNASANGTSYLCGGDDACLNDVNVANTVGVRGTQNSAIGSIQLGSGGASLTGNSDGSFTLNAARPHIFKGTISSSDTGIGFTYDNGMYARVYATNNGYASNPYLLLGVENDSSMVMMGANTIQLNDATTVYSSLNVTGGLTVSGGGNVVYGDNWLKTTHVEGSLGGANVPSGFYESDNPGDGPTSGWTHYLVTAHTGNSYQMILAQPYWSDTLYVQRVDSGTKRGWRAVLDSWNYSGYAIARGGDTVGGVIYFQSNKGSGSYVGSNNTYQLEAYSSDGGAAGMSFHRGGYYAVNMGLDPDNVLRIGGWSAGSNRWQLDMSGNETLAGRIQAPNGWIMGNGTYGGKLNFGDGNYVYLEEPTDDTLVVKASTLKLDSYNTEATNGIRIGTQGAKIKQIFYTGTTSGSNNGRTCINISGNTPPSLANVIDIRGAIYAASNAVIPVHYFQNEWSWGLWYENGSGPTCGAGGPWLSIYPVLWSGYTSLAGRTYNILLTYYE